MDDLLLAGASTEHLHKMVEMLGKELKLKVPSKPCQDGRSISGPQDFAIQAWKNLKFGMDPKYMQDVLEKYKLESAKGLSTPVLEIFFGQVSG